MIEASGFFWKATLLADQTHLKRHTAGPPKRAHPAGMQCLRQEVQTPWQARRGGLGLARASYWQWRSPSLIPKCQWSARGAAANAARRGTAKLEVAAGFRRPPTRPPSPTRARAAPGPSEASGPRAGGGRAQAPGACGSLSVTEPEPERDTVTAAAGITARDAVAH
jgi:hypothetical protein